MIHVIQDPNYRSFDEATGMKLVSMRNENIMIDVILICENTRVPAHKLVLAASSNYLKATFFQTKNSAETQLPTSLLVNGVDPIDVENLIHYIYHGNVGLENEHELDGFIRVCTFLQIEHHGIIQRSLQTIPRKVNEESLMMTQESVNFETLAHDHNQEEENSFFKESILQFVHEYEHDTKRKDCYTTHREIYSKTKEALEHKLAKSVTPNHLKLDVCGKGKKKPSRDEYETPIQSSYRDKLRKRPAEIKDKIISGKTAPIKTKSIAKSCSKELKSKSEFVTKNNSREKCRKRKNIIQENEVLKSLGQKGETELKKKDELKRLTRAHTQRSYINESEIMDVSCKKKVKGTKKLQVAIPSEVSGPRKGGVPKNNNLKRKLSPGGEHEVPKHENKEANRKYKKKLKADPEKHESTLLKQRQYDRKKREQIKEDPEAYAAYLLKHRELKRKKLDELKKDPVAYEASLLKQRLAKRKTLDGLKKDPEAYESFLERHRRSLYEYRIRKSLNTTQYSEF